MSWRKLAVAGVAVAVAAACGAAASDGGDAPLVQVAGVVETRPVETRPPAGPAIDSTSATAPSDAASASTTLLSTTVAPTTEPPATAPPATAPPATATPPTQADISMRDRTIALLDFPWEARLPGWRIEFSSSRSGLRGLTYPDTKVIEIYVRPTDSPASLARVLAHELGHAVDIELNSATDRQRWRDARGIGSGARWWPDPSTSDFDTGAGDFAEAFAVWLTGVTSLSRVGAPLTADHLALVAQLAS